MEKVMREDIYQHARALILEAGQRIRNKIYEPRIISTKSNPNDLVTEMDQQIEAFLVKEIRGNYPNHRIIGEEGYGDDLDTLDGTVWIIDPIDGTMNFVHQLRNFAISIGIYHNGVGEIGLIYDVMADELYHAKRSEGAFKNGRRLEALEKSLKFNEGILGMNHYFLLPNSVVDETVMHKLVRTVRGARTYGSAALEFAYVAEGIIDGYLSMRLAPWDIAAGMVIVREVGGVSSNLDGEPLDLLKVNTVLTCNESIQENLLEFIRKGRK